MSVAIVATAPDQASFRAFLGAAGAVRGNDPRWPAGPPELSAFLLAPDAPWRRHGEAELLVALAGEAPVGALVVALDRRAPHGTFGFFDCVNDESIARALMGAGLTWLRAHGATHAEGPINLHALGGYRLQTKGFERAPFLGEPRNPSWYPELLTRVGFARSAGWRSWDFEGWRLMAFRAFHRVQSWRNPRLRRLGYFTEEMDAARFEEGMARIYPVVMACYEGAPAFWHIEVDEYLRLNLPLKGVPGVRGAMLFKQGIAEPVGFGMGIEEATRGVMHSFGILREHRGKGLAHLVLEHAFAELRKRTFTSVVGALVKEGSSKYDETGGSPTRRYALYRRDTSPLGAAT